MRFVCCLPIAADCGLRVACRALVGAGCLLCVGYCMSIVVCVGCLLGVVCCVVFDVWSVLFAVCCVLCYGW